MSALSDKIWITRKSRIYTEKRLLKKSFIAQTVIIFYSFLLVSGSIWIMVNSNKHMEIFLIVSSIAILITSIFLSSKQYSERAMMVRNCYIRLDELYLKAIRISEEGNEEKLSNIESQYTNILINVENHSDYDYLCMRYSMKHSKNLNLPKFTFVDHLRYLYNKFIRGILIIIIFILPFFISYLWIRIGRYVSID